VTVLQVRGLAKAFGGVRAVRGVSFAVRAGEMVAMIGPNGAGKTTCFNLVNGQLSPDAGEILLGGRPVAGRAPRTIARLGVGRTFQVAAAFGSMTARENVQLALLSHAGRIGAVFALAPRLEREAADALLARVGMLDQAERPAAVLAYGDLKRLEIALALAGAPRLLLMDEPAAGMAPGERAALMRLATSLAREEGVAILFTEHDMDVVFGHADRVLVLVEGELIADGAPEAVRADPRVREAYLGTEIADA
jgi:branched-chain amino acid transport system ATP-binding protein